MSTRSKLPHLQLGCLSTISGLALIGQSSALDKLEGYASALAEHPVGVYFGWAKLSTRGFYKMAMSIGVVCASLCRWILKDRPDWFRDCRAVDALDVLHTTNRRTVELLHMPVIPEVLHPLYTCPRPKNNHDGVTPTKNIQNGQTTRLPGSRAGILLVKLFFHLLTHWSKSDSRAMCFWE
ncbi:hypothetical protein Tco_0676186 [Tanacetum coccineum]